MAEGPSALRPRRSVAAAHPHPEKLILTPAAPVLETERLVLRGWRADDFAPYAAMLADAETARFITRRGGPLVEAQAWAETAFLIGHWQARGFGLFVVEDRESGAFVGRVGALQPPGWPGFEIAWALAPAWRGRGFAVEAARAAARWAFSAWPLDRIVSLIDPANHASQRVAERLGETRTGEVFAPLGAPCEVWAIDRASWEHRQE